MLNESLKELSHNLRLIYLWSPSNYEYIFEKYFSAQILKMFAISNDLVEI